MAVAGLELHTRWGRARKSVHASPPFSTLQNLGNEVRRVS